MSRDRALGQTLLAEDWTFTMTAVAELRSFENGPSEIVRGGQSNEKESNLIGNLQHVRLDASEK